MPKTDSDFPDKGIFVRLVREGEEGAKGRPGLGVFQLADDEDHLSVNHLERESILDICNYYSIALENGSRPTRVSTHQTIEYTNTYKQKCGGHVEVDEAGVKHFVDAEFGRIPLYKHRPVRREGTRPPSPSHCGVEFLRSLDFIKSRKFARLMASKKYHEY